MPAEHRITVSRQARYYTLGDPAAAREVWVVCHGYGQLAERFIQQFEPIVSAERCVVAPEGLHRFYLDPPDRPAAQRRVGATWMTRDDREADIADYVAYIEQVCADAFGSRAPRLVGMGFSQGTASCARWAGATTRSVARLVLWGSGFPPDLDAPALERIREIPVHIVLGDQDEYATPASIAQQEQLMRDAGIHADIIRFQGGHRMDAGTLKQVAGA